MTDDPPVRKNGRCARDGCNKHRPIVAARAAAEAGKPKRLRELQRYAGHQADVDPFCSTRCCRVWHDCIVDVDDLTEETREALSAAGRAGRDKSRRPVAA